MNNKKIFFPAAQFEVDITHTPPLHPPLKLLPHPQNSCRSLTNSSPTPTTQQLPLLQIRRRKSPKRHLKNATFLCCLSFLLRISSIIWIDILSLVCCCGRMYGCCFFCELLCYVVVVFMLMFLLYYLYCVGVFCCCVGMCFCVVFVVVLC